MNKSLFSSNSDEWYTPTHVLSLAVNVFGSTGIGLDPCAAPDSRFWFAVNNFTASRDGLKQNWSMYDNVFVNFPYSNAKEWADKISIESLRNSRMLVLCPARTETKWFHKLINNSEGIFFFKGRLKFRTTNPTKKGSNAPFPSVLIYYGHNSSVFSSLPKDYGFYVRTNMKL